MANTDATYKATTAFTSLNVWQETNTDRTFWCSWAFKYSHVDHYKIVWEYYNGKWYPGTTNTSTAKKDSYSPPQQATAVRVKVTAVSKQHDKKVKDSKTGKTTTKKYNYWTISGYKGPKEINVNIFYNKKMADPATPEVKFKHSGAGYTLDITVPGYSSGIESAIGEIQGYIDFTVEAQGSPLIA